MGLIEFLHSSEWVFWKEMRNFICFFFRGCCTRRRLRSLLLGIDFWGPLSKKDYEDASTVADSFLSSGLTSSTSMGSSFEALLVSFLTSKSLSPRSSSRSPKIKTRKKSLKWLDIKVEFLILFNRKFEHEFVKRSLPKQEKNSLKWHGDKVIL